MPHPLEIRTGHNLMCIGIYTVSFEAMVLLWRQQLHEYLSNHEVGTLPKFKKACKTADKTFSFCEPYLLAANIVSQDELDQLSDIRQRRNVFAHEGYNSIWSLHYSDISADLDFIDKMAFNVQNWRFETPITKPPMKVGDSFRVTVSPRIFTNVIRGFAMQLASGILHYDLDEIETQKRSENEEAEQAVPPNGP